MPEVTATIALPVNQMQALHDWLSVQHAPDLTTQAALGLLLERTTAALRRARARGRVLRAHSPQEK